LKYKADCLQNNGFAPKINLFLLNCKKVGGESSEVEIMMVRNQENQFLFAKTPARVERNRNLWLYVLFITIDIHVFSRSSVHRENAKNSRL
jgi:hypothetical protein